MEDEYHEVRSNTIQSMCGLAAECPEFGAECMPHLVDMLNDEIQGVRLLAIVTLQSISEVELVSKLSHFILLFVFFVI